MDGLAQKTLTQCLQRLERNCVIERRLIDGAPPGVEYRVIDIGRTLDKPFGAMSAWTSEHGDAVGVAQRAFDARQDQATALAE